MSVKVENNLSNKIYSFLLNRKINRFLKLVPQSHLIGIGKIVVDYSLHGKAAKGSAAIYNRKYDHKSASIEIAFDSIYSGLSKVLLFIPFFGSYIFASVLYHEIGHHHHHTIRHGVRKQKSEDYANQYKREMLDKAFWGWKILLRPIAPILRSIARSLK